MATIKDVSKLAGVSVATVSRYLNKNGYVSKDAQQAIAEVIEKLNYRPNTIARSLAGKKTATIGLMVPDILNPFFPEIARAAEDAANEHGYTVMLCNTDNDTAKEQRYIDTLIYKQADGVIISSYTIQPEHLTGLRKAGIPVVLLDNVFSNDSVVSLTVENKEGGEMAVRHLLERGCRKIAHICGPLSITSSRERTAGYETVSTGTDWFTPGLIAYSDFTVRGGYSAMQQLLAVHPDLDGVFASNDLMAAGALKALKEAGRNVPEDVKVIGFDGIQLEMVSPELSTIAQPNYELGKTAMDVLIGLITKQPDIPGDKVFPVTLTVRESTGG
ncbi:LacI family DNA-binding transcriptional regulator [Sporosarcina koreensis]|uniref:LacI family DNA-binding transcriptional regulator n=1 Tax=Sporosarcina koreensis TaxID=334735 RepID=UPI00058D3037|nr:LacI family DNA-binding transcriptional regulator [Sporosarcina koreensis]